MQGFKFLKEKNGIEDLFLVAPRIRFRFEVYFMAQFGNLDSMK